MPERVTKEERRVSLAIEKARAVKELLHQSMEGNRLPDEEDDMEQVKVKRPKAENDKTKIENNDGTHSGYGKGGEETHFKKAVRQFLSNAESFYGETVAMMRTLPDKRVRDNFEHELDKISQQKGGTPLTYDDVNNAKIIASKSRYSREK
jgi:hypothetical protein